MNFILLFIKLIYFLSYDYVNKFMSHRCNSDSSELVE